MKALIIEDESPAARRLQKMIRNVRNDVEILDVLDSVESGVTWLSENDQPDVIFSDIQLADGKSFDIYSQVNITCPIIFTTAYDEYAIKAFELNSVGYLLKPFSEDDLNKVISKVEELPSESSNNLNQVLSQLGIDKKYKSRFLIHKGDSLIPVATKEIAYIYTHDKLVVLVTKENQHFYLNQRMDELENQLDPKDFFRLNRQYISSFDAIEKVANHFNGKLRVYLKPVTEEEVMISRIKAAAFKAWLDE